MEKVLRINVKTKDINYEDTPMEYLQTGGRGLIAKILLKEVKPTCEPLGKNNKLIFATGLLTGTNVSSASRLSIGAKSPLTGGIKESNAGGIMALRLAQIGLKALIIEDIPDDDKWYYIKISKENCSFEPADKYIEMGTFDFCTEMLNEYPDSAVSCIGPAGERLYSASGIATMDKDKKPNRYSGRGGLGAVMGSKKIKGVVVIDKGTVKIENNEQYMKSLKEYTKILSEAPSSLNFKKLGTASVVRTTQSLNGLPVNNFSGDLLEEDIVDNIYGETLYEVISKRGGEGRTYHSCMPGCVIQCSNVFPDENGKTIVSPLEYETIGLLGPNLGITNLDVIAKLNAVCNDIGVDTIEIGAAIGVAMEAGIAKFGDVDAAFELMEEIKKGTILGRVLGNGATITGKVLGVINVPAVNGQAMPAYDPRAIKGMGVTYSTSPMGADHTYGPIVKCDKSFVESSNEAQIKMAIIDSLGFCMFVRAAIGANYKVLVDLINGRYGWNKDVDWVLNLAKETISDEHKFNELAGFSNVNYHMPECFTEREISNLKTSFDVNVDELNELVSLYKW